MAEVHYIKIACQIKDGHMSNKGKPQVPDDLRTPFKARVYLLGPFGFSIDHKYLQAEVNRNFGT